MQRVRTTGCARFFLVLIILIPLAFIGASLYQGKNPMDAISELFGKDEIVEEQTINGINSKETADIKSLQDKIEKLEQELEDCRNK